MIQCVMFHEGTMDVGLMQRKSIFQDTIDPESIEEILMGLASQIGLRKNTFMLFIESKLIHSLQSRTGPVQGQNRVFPVYHFHTGRNLCSIQGYQVMKTGFSLLEILHRENPVLITVGCFKLI